LVNFQKKKKKHIEQTLTEQKWKLKRIMALRQVENFTGLHISSSTNFWATLGEIEPLTQSDF